MAPKRAASAAAAAAETAETAKRFRSAVSEVVDEFICPITHELPLDRVIAEDSNIYERSAIEEWLRRSGPAKSPMTNEPMGKKLLPAKHVRNTIEKLVRSGGIEGEKAAQWKAKLEDEALVAETRRKAEDGDADAMMNLGLWYAEGTHGLAANRPDAYRWTKRAAALGHATGMAFAGGCLCHGAGVETDTTLGAYYLTRAAGKGSRLGHLVLGTMFAEGEGGFPKDVALAKNHLGEVVSDRCSIDDLPDGADHGAEYAATTLRELQ